MAALPKTSAEVRCVAPVGAMLGEGPLWFAAENSVYWVDILGAKVFRHCLADGRTEVGTLPLALTSLAPMRDGRLLGTGWHGIYSLDTRSGALAEILRLDIDARTLRINDGACDADGGFWFGTMDLEERRPLGDFYRLAADASCTRITTAFAISNGPAFSPAGDRGYFVDTLGRRILQAEVENGMPVQPLRPFVQIAQNEGFPDGLAIDADGGVWCAHWGGSRVTRFDAEGRVTDIVRLPVSNVTKCAFGGEDLDRLFISTARKDLDTAALRAEPLAGGLFEAEVGYRGVAPAAYQGEPRAGPPSGTCFFRSV
ncbi:MAG: SMP-30/gluconolactonase/LRE family protein [Rudaea sp.]|uniref:SMP-30/gluconolactonase/LRE family protein n=1 Tax=unclassified Rudaea TaxID=2627037 RepID=UPI0010F474DC|nr:MULTISPECIES: SMP-30/gluconolactonase/LRE family protein [unclassified Rudaea]MBN8888256.1 SMP-30/gluconolactonase/LRE family protein [Rudaea sp.]